MGMNRDVNHRNTMSLYMLAPDANKSDTRRPGRGRVHGGGGAPRKSYTFEALDSVLANLKPSIDGSTG